MPPIKERLTKEKARRLLRLRKATLLTLYITSVLLFIYLSVNLASLLPNILLKYLSPLVVIVPVVYGIATRGKVLGDQINRFCIRYILRRPVLMSGLMLCLLLGSAVSISRIIHEARLFSYHISNQRNNTVKIRILFANSMETMSVPPHDEVVKSCEYKIITIQDICTEMDPMTIYPDSTDETLYVIPYDNVP